MLQMRKHIGKTFCYFKTFRSKLVLPHCYIQGKDLTVSFFFCFCDQGKKVYKIRVTSLMKPLSQNQSITIAKPITTTIIMSFQVNQESQRGQGQLIWF